MKILFLAPQPFFQERGTPIAVRLALEVLSKRSNDKIDLLTYHEGADVEIPHVSINRIPSYSRLKNIRPGISVSKLICDVIFFFSALKLIISSRQTPYTLIHAVEESVFMAYFFKLIFKIPYIYDMDSSLSMQITEKWTLLKPLAPIFEFFESLAIRNSLAVVPVCDALAALADKHGAPDLQILRDISLLNDKQDNFSSDIRKELNLNREQEIVMYIGNLESYQGIDLLIEAFALTAPKHQSAQLVIIGGNQAHIEYYKKLGEKLLLQGKLHLVGPKPVSQLRNYLLQADILTSPRIKGNNTPMKIYSYLHSGIPIVATELPTNTQVLTNEIAKLAKPNADAFSCALLELLQDPAKRKRIGEAAQALAEKHYTFSVFEQSLNALYDRLAAQF